MVAIKKIHVKKIRKLLHHKKLLLYLKALTWFSVGALIGLFFILSFAYIFFKQLYSHTVFPGVTVAGVPMGGKDETYVENYFNQKNAEIGNNTFTIVFNSRHATISAGQIQAGYNSALLAKQAISIGKSKDIFSDITLVFQAYLSGINLPPSYTFSVEKLTELLTPMQKDAYIMPVDALFQFTGGKVTTFKPSANGQDIDFSSLTQSINQKIPYFLALGKQQNIEIELPTKILYPQITTEKANNLGIKELIGTGTSLFKHSIPSRIYNIQLAASKLNGIIVAPNEEFSFDKALGDISVYTGYQQAYVIENGKTVLGDGGGVCQVSTTMFRAILNAGLPVTERHAHAYRVGYYEEDSPPGIDATIYVPTVDLKFKNDTGHNILIQTSVDSNQLRLTISLYGVTDGRQVSMTTPVVTNEIPAPSARYQNDPTLPVGTVKQVDFAANGATATFNRIVTKNGKQIINETYVSHYRAWQAVYLVGTK